MTRPISRRAFAICIAFAVFLGLSAEGCVTINTGPDVDPDESSLARDDDHHGDCDDDHDDDHDDDGDCDDDGHDDDGDDDDDDCDDD